MSKSGITAITITDNQTGESATVSPEAFDRYAAGLRGGRPMVAATMTAQHIRPPQEAEFGDEAYIPATTLEAVADSLIAEHRASLGHIGDLQVAVLWKKTGGKRGGHPVFGKTSKRGGLLSAFTTADFIIWLAADHVLEAGYTERQITALLHHELLHIGWQSPDEDDPEGEGKAVLAGHDFELFAEEIRTYGAWEQMLEEAAEAFAQAPLFEN